MAYACLLLFAFVTLVMGLAIVVFSFFSKSILFRWLSVLSLLAYIAIVVLVAIRVTTDEPEWNPDIKNDQEVVGIWTDKHQKLDLTSDHHFTYQNNAVVTSGVWSRNDWNLYLKPNVGGTNDPPPVFRFIQYKGHLRVLTHEAGDPDGWNGDIGLPRK